MENSKDDNKTVLLKPDTRKWLLILLFAAAGVVVAQLSGSDMKGGVFGYWFVLVFGSVGSLIAAIQLIPGSSSLKLDRAGITITKVFRKRFVPWCECSEFKVWAVDDPYYWLFRSRSEFVLFSSGRSDRNAEANKKLFGEDDSLPDTYGMSAQALCDLLNEWRRTQIKFWEV